jgi:hypothetical protein
MLILSTLPGGPMHVTASRGGFHHLSDALLQVEGLVVSGPADVIAGLAKWRPSENNRAVSVLQADHCRTKAVSVELSEFEKVIAAITRAIDGVLNLRHGRGHGVVGRTLAAVNVLLPARAIAPRPRRRNAAPSGTEGTGMDARGHVAGPRPRLTRT